MSVPKHPAGQFALALLKLGCIFTVMQLMGCAGPAYYAQAINGHLAIMRQRKAVDEILQQPETDPRLRRELELALEIREFAVSQLGLPENDSYTSIVQTGRSAVTWNVIAAPRFSLQAKEWCFPVAGCVPYRGYFNQQQAGDFAKTMQDRSFDVTVSPAIAYSTLGWFDDPLLDTMFQYSEEQLAAFIFHELAHQLLYIRGDAAFNEGFATFVEETGVRLWLVASGRADKLPEWQSLESASAQFNALLQKIRDQLVEEYASGDNEDVMLASKEAIFAGFRSEYQDLLRDQWQGKNYFESWFSVELNNARLALIDSYRGNACAFEGLYAEAGRDLHAFHRLAAEKAGLDKVQRAEWLNQPCESIASGHDL